MDKKGTTIISSCALSMRRAIRAIYCAFLYLLESGDYTNSWVLFCKQKDSATWPSKLISTSQILLVRYFHTYFPSDDLVGGVLLIHLGVVSRL